MQWSKLFVTLVAGASSFDIQECSGSCNSSSTNEQIALVQRHASHLVTERSALLPLEHYPVGSGVDGGWRNDWDRDMNFECSGDQVLVGAYSVHDNGREDRRWKLECAGFVPASGYLTPTLNSCSWTGETGWDAAWTEPNRGGNFVITGLKSRHDNGREDRVWRFKSCQIANVDTGPRSGMSGWHNGMDGVLDVKLSNTQFFADWKSQHCNGAEDRHFAFDLGYFYYQAAPTPAPTQNPTTESPTPEATVSAHGDPHLVNTRGEHFSIFTSGQVEFIRVPYESLTEQADFTVHATIQTFGETTDKCKEAQYITGMRFGGSWFKGKPLDINVDFVKPGATRKEMKVLLGGVPVMPSTDPIDVGDKMALEMEDNSHLVLKVDGAAVAVNLQYYFLNVEANSLSKLAQKIGGVLGEDDHAAISMKPAGCERALAANAAQPIYSSARATA